MATGTPITNSITDAFIMQNIYKTENSDFLICRTLTVG